jgi:hypothetical protein
VVVIETDNYLPRQRDGCIDEIEAGTTESRWVEKQLGRPVVKLFNNIYVEHVRVLGKFVRALGASRCRSRANTARMLNPRKLQRAFVMTHKNLSLSAAAFGFR